MEKYLIYALLDPVSQTIRYVGKSCSGLRRPKEHWKRKSNLLLKDHCHNWIRQVISKGLFPEIKILETVGDKFALSSREIFWIGKLRLEGVDLTNSTDGGDGATVGRRLSESTKRKIGLKNSVSLLGNIPWNKGKKNCFSTETLTHWSKVRTGRKATSETRNRISQSNTGQKRSRETCLNISNSLKGNVWNIRKVFCTTNGNEYESVRDAAKKLNLNRHCISSVCRGILKQTGGHLFRFLESNDFSKNNL